MSEVPGSGPLLTALILTHNEEANIGRTLEHLGWVGSILVIDSGSSDATLSILASHPGGPGEAPTVRQLRRPVQLRPGSDHHALGAEPGCGLPHPAPPWPRRSSG